MYLMFVDESGDTGLTGSPTRFFILSGIVVHELRWKTVMDELLDFRRSLKKAIGLKLSEEIHAAAFFSSGSHVTHIPKHQRLEILRRLADKLATLRDIVLLNVVVDKSTKPANYDVFEHAWTALLQRFENTLGYKNFPGARGRDDRGLLFCDQTDEAKLRKLIRRMRSYNPVPNQPWVGQGYRNLLLTHVIEDPNCRNSSFSNLVQAVDVSAYLLKQHLQPSSYFKNKSAQHYFHRLDPVCFKQASRTHPQGVVIL